MRLRRRTLLSGVALALASLSLVQPSVSPGSVTIGSDLTATGATVDHNCGSSGCTVLQTALPGRQLAAPSSGLIVRWRERGYGPGTATLRIARLLSSFGPPWTTSFLRSSVAQPTGGLGVVTFPVSPPLPISAGDTIGVTGSADNIEGASEATGATDTIYAEESPLDGTTVNSTNIKSTNDDWLYDADIVAPPTSSAATTACPGSTLTLTVTAAPDPATGPKAAHFSIDGGPEQTAATAGNPGAVTVSLGSGVHTLEFWGEDLLGQQETSHHTITAGCPNAKPPPPGLLGATGPTPTLSHVSQTHRIWREGNRLAHTTRRRPPVGTVFSFALNEPARVRLTFTQFATGRQVGGQCVAQTRTNRTRHTCKGTLARAAFAFTAHTATNKVAFQGRLSSSHRLKPGAYTLVIAATNLAGDKTVFSRLNFTIVP